MNHGGWQGVLRKVRRLAAPDAGDAELLERFLASRDEAAFAALVERHGPLVLRVCRRVLRSSEDADDAFQVTFLVLARKAASVRRRASLASWLYGAAYRSAMEIERQSARRRRREQQASRPPPQPSELDLRELQAILEEEIARLPEKYRAPFVLCCLEGRSKSEAAAELGWKEGTVSGRLAEARKILQRRLTRRGVTLAAALAAAAIAPAATACVPATLAMVVAKRAIDGIVSPVLAVAVSRVIHSAFRVRATALLVVAGIGLLAAGAGALQHSAPTQPQETPPPAKTQLEPSRLDLFGDPLPAEAVARLGTVRWRLGNHRAECMVASADGKELIAANAKTGVWVFETVSGRVIRRLAATAEQRADWLGGAVGLSADGRTAALGSKAGEIRLLDVASGKELRRWKGHGGCVRDALLSANAGLLVTRADDRTLRVWDTAAGAELWQMPFHAWKFDQQQPVEIALAPDGKTLAWVDNGPRRAIHLCNARSGQERHRLDDQEAANRRIAISPDSGKLLAVSDVGPGRIWDVATGRELLQLTDWRKPDFFPTAAFTPDSQKLFFFVGGDARRLVDANTGRELYRAPLRWTSNVSPVYTFSPDGTTVFEAWYDPMLRRFDALTGRQLSPAEEPWNNPFYDLAFSQDGRFILSAGNDHSLCTWDPANGRELSRKPVGDRGSILSPGATLLATHDRDTIAVFERSGRELWRRREPGWEMPFAFSVDGKLLVSRRDDAAILREAASGKQVRRLEMPTHDALFSPDARHLFTFQNSPPVQRADSRVRIWDYQTGREYGSISINTWSIEGATVSPDGKSLAVHRDGVLELWEVATRQKRLTIGETEAWPYRFQFAPEGDLLLVSNPYGMLRLHEVATGQSVLRLENESGQILRFAFSPDGRRLAASNSDMTALVWDWPALRARCEKLPPPEPRDPAQSWAELAEADAVKAYRALWALRAIPNLSVGFLKEQLRPEPPVDAGRIDRWIEGLDNNSFAVRKESMEALQRMGEGAEPALRLVLQGKPSVEIRQRVEQLLARLDWNASSERLRVLRAIEILEHIATPEAQDVLKSLASGPAEGRLTQEARASLKRLSRRAR